MGQAWDSDLTLLCFAWVKSDGYWVLIPSSAWGPSPSRSSWDCILWQHRLQDRSSACPGMTGIIRTCVLSCEAGSDSLWPRGLWPTGLLCLWDFPSKSTGVGFHFLHQQIFPTQGSNLGLLHCRWILFNSPGWGSMRAYMNEGKYCRESMFCSPKMFSNFFFLALSALLLLTSNLPLMSKKRGKRILSW